MIDANSQFFAILTKVGRAKQANADALGIPWKITDMGVGDANDTDPIPSETQTRLINEWRRRPLNQLRVDPANSAVIIAEQIIPADEGGRWIREIGLYDADGDLIAVANCAPSFKPMLSQGSGRTQVVRMNFIVSSTGNITLKIDPAVVLATREYVDQRILEELYKLDSKQSVRVATTGNIALAGLQTIDGVALVAGNRVLVKNQTVAKDNGLYIAAAGVWSRALDADTSAEVTSALLVSVEQGATLADTRWQLVTDGVIVLGVTALTFQNVTQGFAPINSPALLGVPTAPTADQSVSNTQIATTAFAKQMLAAVGFGDVTPTATIPDMNDVSFPSGFYYASAAGTKNLPVAANGTVLHKIYGGGGLQIFQAYASNALLWRRKSLAQWEAWNSLAALDSPVFIGSPAAPTPPQFSSDKSVATTEFVQRSLGNYRRFTSLTSETTLTETAVGTLVTVIGTFNLTVPPASLLPSGGAIHFRNIGSGVVTVVCAGTDSINSGTGAVTTILLQPGATLELSSNGDKAWWAAGSAQLQYSRVFSSTPVQFDASDLVVNARFVKRMGMEWSSFNSVSASTTLSNASVGSIVNVGAAAAVTITLPPTAPIASGGMIKVVSGGTGSVTIAGSNGELCTNLSGSAITLVLGQGDSAILARLTGEWRLVGGSMALKYSALFAASMTLPGISKLPSGFVEQWGQGTTSTSGDVEIVFPVAWSIMPLGIHVTPVLGQDVARPTILMAAYKSATGLTRFSVGGFQNNGSRIGETFFWRAIGKI